MVPVVFFNVKGIQAGCGIPRVPDEIVSEALNLHTANMHKVTYPPYQQVIQKMYQTSIYLSTTKLFTFCINVKCKRRILPKALS